MFNITGKFSTARVYASIIDTETERQIYEMVNSPLTEGASVAIMPDTHAGKGATIGTTIKLGAVPRVSPSTVGVDIGCGMLVCKFKIPSKWKDVNGKIKESVLASIDTAWRKVIPMGKNHRDTVNDFVFSWKYYLRELKTPVNIYEELEAMGTLGGGNHFGELDIDTEGNGYFIIHSGSRHLGVEIAKYWQRIAIKAAAEKSTLRLNEGIAQLKKEGRTAEISGFISKYKAENPLPAEHLAYLEGDLLNGYLADMKIAQEYAQANRALMMVLFLRELDLKVSDSFETVHNYISFKDMTVRKGAISLNKDEVALIPLNMRDGSLIVKGKGNVDWNCSGPHGAGRILSRSQAKASVDINEFKDAMKNVYSTSVNESTLDESPMAYKDAEVIISDITETADIITRIVPVWNVKAGE